VKDELSKYASEISKGKAYTRGGLVEKSREYDLELDLPGYYYKSNDFTPEQISKIKELKENVAKYSTKQYFDNAYKEEVQKALSEGKPVPPEVLAEYPEIAAKPEQPIPQVEKSAETVQPEQPKQEAQPTQTVTQVRKSFAQSAKKEGVKPALADAVAYNVVDRIRAGINKGEFTQEEVNKVIGFAEGKLEEGQIGKLREKVYKGIGDNYGVHFGDLGKADYLNIMPGRDTGHFGTGTYFFGSE
jgi:hypothetical protein